MERLRANLSRRGLTTVSSAALGEAIVQAQVQCPSGAAANAASTALSSQTAWAASGDPQAPRYRRISGSGGVEEIKARALEALA